MEEISPGRRVERRGREARGWAAPGPRWPARLRGDDRRRSCRSLGGLDRRPNSIAGEGRTGSRENRLQVRAASPNSDFVFAPLRQLIAFRVNDMGAPEPLRERRAMLFRRPLPEFTMARRR